MRSETKLDQLLEEREAKGLRVIIYARIVLLSGFTITNLMIREDFIEKMLLLSFTLPLIGLWALLSIKIKPFQKLRLIGFWGAISDVFLLGFLFSMIYLAEGGAEIPVVFLPKSMFLLVALSAMVINSLAFRPQYTLILCGGILCLYFMMMGLVIVDERTIFSFDLVGFVLGPDVNPPLMFFTIPVIILINGLFLSYLNHTGRQTILRTYQLEKEKAEIAEKMLQVVQEQNQTLEATVEQRTAEIKELQQQIGTDEALQQLNEQFAYKSQPTTLSHAKYEAISFPQGNGESIYPDLITHISVIEHYSYIYVNTPTVIKEIQLRATLKEVLQELPEELFVQIHRSHVINMDYIAQIKKSQRAYHLFLHPKATQLPISRHRLLEILPRLQMFIQNL